VFETMGDRFSVLEPRMSKEAALINVLREILEEAAQ
jgi:hypothetical protein